MHLGNPRHGPARGNGDLPSQGRALCQPADQPGKADSLIAMKAENLAPHGGYLKPTGWAAVNGTAGDGQPSPLKTFFLDADGLAAKLGNPKAVNLIMLGFFLARNTVEQAHTAPFFCDLEDISVILEKRLHKNPQLLAASVQALKIGVEYPP
nr:2-oxoacid:acceptor oxidoreductase family protein [Desulfosarcina cetonica]